MSTYAIGDIQGCYKPLQKLLRKVDFQPGKDQLWCVGDLINRGPKSLDTLRYLRELGDNVTIVLGNHDLHFLAIYYGASDKRNKDTLQELLDAPDCAELSDWLRHQRLAHYASVQTQSGPQSYLMVHAGVAPKWTLQKTLALAAEVEQSLQGPDFREFFAHMYGDTPKRWRNKLHGYKRLRVITNYLTRMRFCNEKGTLNLQIKEGLLSAPAGYKPWFEFEQITPETNILFGHWAALEGKTGKPAIFALDTGCVWGRELSMLRLEDHTLFSV